MPKNYHCAQCGGKLKVIQKAIPQKGIVLNLVEPHSCEETKEEDKFVLFVKKLNKAELLKEKHEEAHEVEKKPKLDFDFVKKLNKAVEVEPMTSGPGDLRPKSSRREELPTSTAPLSILNKAPREAGLASPAEDDREFDDG